MVFVCTSLLTPHVLRTDEQRLVLCCKELRNEQIVEQDCHLQLKLRVVGGKGGFGALLRGAGNKSGKKISQDDCRDLSGRRIRHVKNEQKLAEWYASQKERELAQKKEREEQLQRKREEAEESKESTMDTAEFNNTIRTITENTQNSVEEAIRRQKEEAKKKKEESVQPKKRKILWYVGRVCPRRVCCY